MYSEAQKRGHIYDLQRFLRRIQQDNGHKSPVAPDGIYGGDTRAAVLSFQQANGLPATGTADLQTWQGIYDAYLALKKTDARPKAPIFFPSSPTALLMVGDRGLAVLSVQMILQSLLPHFPTLLTVPLSGNYEQDTADAVREMQEKLQLAPTGQTDRKTWDALTELQLGYYERIPLGWQQDSSFERVE